ncbi:hydrogenase [Pasteurellaceae bacterium LFhippo2]|nr:hydrogenase [Pasteurellaceae bacterium LFhippo2]
MFKLLKTVFKQGDVTTKYPFKPYEVDPDFRGKPELNSEQCIVCGACTMACPSNALTLRTDTEKGDRTWSLFLGRCIFCGRCEEVCPTKAIRLSQDFELSVKNKQDLFQETTFSTTTCQQCHKPFTSYKELNYAIELLKLQSNDPNAVNQRLEVLHTCPECKRQNSLDKTANMEEKMQVKLIAYDEKNVELDSALFEQGQKALSQAFVQEHKG